MELKTATRKIGGVAEVIDNAIPDTEYLLDQIQKVAKWDQSVLGGGVSRHDAEIRDNDSYFINPLEFANMTPDLYALHRHVWFYLDDYGRRYDVGFSTLEPACVNRYFPGQRYKAHADAGRMLPRVISAVLYLNTVSDGGETHFIYHNESVSPVAGRLLIFPSDYSFTHSALPPKEETKYAIAYWTKH
jgi:hypothetical protein